MPQLSLATLLVAAGATSTALEPAVEPGAKCAGRPGAHPDMPAIVLIVDDEVLEIAPEDWDQKAYDIDHVEIVCWSWVERTYGVIVRQAGIFVVTKGWAERKLDSLVDAQEAHRRATGSYASRVGDLNGFVSPIVMTIHLWGAEAGWAAMTEHDLWPRTCYVFEGTPPEDWNRVRPGDQPPLAEREPVCLLRGSATQGGSAR